LELNHAVRLLGVKAKHERNLRFKITSQDELFQITAVQVAITVGDGWLARIGVCLRRVHGNLQKCISGHNNIVS
jgi:hypothetical protein